MKNHSMAPGWICVILIGFWADDSDSFELVSRIERLEDIWQLHRALDTDDSHNTSEYLIANHSDEDACDGHWIRAMVHPDGLSYVLMNSRYGSSRTYVSN